MSTIDSSILSVFGAEDKILDINTELAADGAPDHINEERLTQEKDFGYPTVSILRNYGVDLELLHEVVFDSGGENDIAYIKKIQQSSFGTPSPSTAEMALNYLKSMMEMELELEEFDPSEDDRQKLIENITGAFNPSKEPVIKSSNGSELTVNEILDIANLNTYNVVRHAAVTIKMFGVSPDKDTILSLPESSTVSQMLAQMEGFSKGYLTAEMIIDEQHSIKLSTFIIHNKSQGEILTGVENTGVLAAVEYPSLTSATMAVSVINIPVREEEKHEQKMWVYNKSQNTFLHVDAPDNKAYTAEDEKPIVPFEDIIFRSSKDL